MYIKSKNLFSKVFPSSAEPSLYSASLLSYFHSSSISYTNSSSSTDSSSRPIYHEPIAQHHRDTNPPPPQEPPPPPPPPLPARNSDMCVGAEHSIIYSPDSNYPRLKINIPSHGYSSLESKLSGQSKLQALLRRPSLPSRVVTHELNLERATPQSEVESLMIETTDYVKDIKKRRKNIHATLLRERTPGERLRRMLGYRIEQRLVKVLSTRRTYSRRKRPQKKTKKARRNSSTNFKKKFFAPQNFFHRLSKKISRRGKSRLKSYYMDFDNHDCSDTCDCSSRSPTPRFIVDRQGAIRWPPFKINNEGDRDDENQSIPEQTDDVGIENFTLKKPLTLTESSISVPRVLGWLQVEYEEFL